MLAQEYNFGHGEPERKENEKGNLQKFIEWPI